MKTTVLAALSGALALASAHAVCAAAADTDADAALRPMLVEMENGAWVAWKARDGKHYDRFLSADHLDIHASGPVSKADVVELVGSPICVVRSYTLGDMQYSRISSDTAMLLYRVEQDTTCGSTPVTSPTWVTSIYVKRGGRWLNFLFESAPARK